jgi:hypothetical protein
MLRFTMVLVGSIGLGFLIVGFDVLDYKLPYFIGQR